MISYCKLRTGAWGLRSSTELAPGQVVSVTTKAGAIKSETIDRVVWSGNGIWICSVVQRASGPRRHECDECGEYVTPGSVCWETGMVH